MSPAMGPLHDDPHFSTSRECRHITTFGTFGRPCLAVHRPPYPHLAVLACPPLTCSHSKKRYTEPMTRLGVLAAVVSAAAAAKVENNKSSPPRPHVLFVVGDDVGYSDFGFFNDNKATGPHTPHMPRRAAGHARRRRFSRRPSTPCLRTASSCPTTTRSRSAPPHARPC